MDSLIPLNWHEEFITRIAQLCRPKVYMELGLYKCDLFNKIIPYAEKLIGVDLSPEAGHFMQDSPKVTFINAPSNDFAEQLKSCPIQIDLLFIDANHTKASVLDDFHNYFLFVAPHGLILLHDTYPTPDQVTPEYCDTAYQAIWELTTEYHDYEMVTIPVPPGLTICRKRQTQLSWQAP